MFKKSSNSICLNLFKNKQINQKHSFVLRSNNIISKISTLNQQQQPIITRNYCTINKNNNNKNDNNNIKDDNKAKIYQHLSQQIQDKSNFGQDHDQYQHHQEHKQQQNSWKAILTRNAISFGVFGFLSLGGAVYLATSDDTEYMIKYADQILDEIANATELSILESKLKTISEYSSNNDTLKKILSSKKNINQLLDVIEDYSNVDLNVYAVKTIENASIYISDYSLIPRIVKLSMTEYLPVYVRKQLGLTIANIATHEDARVILANAGAITALEQLFTSKMAKCQAFRTALLVISDTCSKNTSDLIITEDEMNSINRYSAEEREVQSSSLQSTKRKLIDSGWLLYFHTSAGGFVWGCIESWRNQLPLNAILKNGFRTSIVTAAIPIFFVGAMTTLFNNQRKKIDTTKEKFYFYLAGFYSLYPWYYILPKIERYAPYWIGGHVLGFMSFFTWLVYTKNEIFTSDTLIIQKDKASPPREKLIKMNQEKKLLEQKQQQTIANVDNNKK